MVDDRWKECRLAEICQSIDYGYTASAKADPVGPRFLRITDIVSGHIDWENVPYCDINEIDKQKYHLNHVLFANILNSCKKGEICGLASDMADLVPK